MKKTTLTERKAEQAPTGGVLVGKRKGQTIIHDEGSLSGYLVGKTHAEGGIKAVNKATGQPLEMQGGEVVITAPAVADQTKNQFNGKMMTNREILSQINVNGGGVAFANGGDIPKSIKHTGATYNYGGKVMKDHEILYKINGGHLAKGKTLSQIAKMHNVTLKQLQSQVNMGMKAESEHTSSKREQMKIVKDHLYENPKYYTLLKKAGLKKGGSLVKDAKSGNTPARDLNNYNDVLDVDADGVVGAETGLYANGGDVDFDVDGTGGADASSGVGAFEDGGSLGDNYYTDKSRFPNEGEIILPKDVDYEMISFFNRTNKILSITLKNGKKVRASVGKFYNDLIFSAKNLPKKIEYSPYSLQLKEFEKIEIIDSYDNSVGAFDNGGEVGSFLNYYFEELKDFLKTQNNIILNDDYTFYYKGEKFTIEPIILSETLVSESIKEANFIVYDLDDEIVGNIEFNPNANKKFIANSEFFEWNNKKFEDGGELDFLDDVERIFDEGGSTDLPKVEYVTITSVGNRTVYSELVGEIYGNIEVLKYDLNKFFKEKNETPSYIYIQPNDSSNNFGISFKKGKNTVLNFNPLTGQNSDIIKQLERRYPRSIKKYDWNDFYQNKNRPSDKQEPKKESSAPTSASEKRIVVDYLVQIENEASIGNIQGLKNYIDKLFTKGESRVAFKILSSGKIIDESFFYIYFSSESDPSDKRHFNVLQDLDALKYAIFGSDSNLKYNWDEFFEVEPKEETKQEEPIRNFELEKKYLTQRINALSSELDLKRPILSNEEIAFYQREINKFVSKLRVVSNDEMELKPIQARVNGVYKVKWGDYTKQYPETDTLSINGVKSELTFEEYLTVRTPEFKSFFGNWEQAYFDNTYSGVSKIINPKTKEPMPVFHGTNVLFTEWKTYETNNAHYFAVKREMSDFFATSWETRSDKAGVDSKAIKALNPNTGTFLYRCFLDIRNPIDFSKFGVEKRPIKEFLLFLKINYNIGDYDFWTNLGNARGFTSETRVYAWQIIRLWQNFTKYVKNFTTYDGYIFYEYIPDTPFGGLENASLSFCAFESNQIKFADAYEFNALSNDSRFDFGGTL